MDEKAGEQGVAEAFMLKKIFLMILLALLNSGCATQLTDTAYSSDIVQIKELLDSGVNVNEENNPLAGETALHAAVMGDASPDVAKLLIDRGINVNKARRDGSRPIHLAIVQGNAALLKVLLDNGADIHVSSPFGTPQQAATKHGDPNIIRILAEAEEKQNPKSTVRSSSAHPSPPSKNSDRVSHTADVAIAKTDIEENIPTGKPAGKYDLAVVIGNANYSATGTPNVDFALQDAQSMRQYLIKTFGYDPANIIFVENATLTKLNEIFGTESNYQGKLYKWVKPHQSKIFIYYVGHGAPDQQTGEGYFVPVDANPQYISTSGYKLSTFYENLSKIPAAKKTVVIDACFSGSSANGQLLKGVSGLTARLKPEPKATVAADLLLTSAGMDQVASWYPEKGHSLFTYFFLKGIQGEADSNKDGRITMGEMKIWLNEQVPYMARRITGNQQQPVMMGKDGDELVNLTR